MTDQIQPEGPEGKPPAPPLNDAIVDAEIVHEPERRERRGRSREEDDDDYGADRFRKTDATGGLIPYRNPLALTGYYLAVFSLIPCVSLFLGPAALILGILGLKHARKYPSAGGSVHAIVALVLGGLTTFGTLAFMVFLVLAASAGK